jgi:hypothetical protein
LDGKGRQEGEARENRMRTFHNLFSPNIIRVIKSRRMRCVVYAARMEDMKNAYKMLVRKPKGERAVGR